MIAAMQPSLDFLTSSSRWAQKGREPIGSDFVAGNPQSVLPEYVEALARWLPPRNDHWYGYKLSEPLAQSAAANGLHVRGDVPFEPEDIIMTNGAMSGLMVTLHALVDPGDEVIYFSPPWFFYNALITASNATPVCVTLSAPSYDLDLDKLRSAISNRTKAVIINTPNNPTGRVYPSAVLAELAGLLEKASFDIGHPIFLISDEAYSRILFDDHIHTSPAVHYRNAILIYTYGKTLLTPGQRIGYIALPPSMPQRKEIRSGLLATLFASGYAFPSALLQHALPDIEHLSIDIATLQSRRDRIVTTLQEQGYAVNNPQGTFYVLATCPTNNDYEFIGRLAEENVYVLPGSLIELPGHFRLSLTASDEMIERALPIFRRTFDSMITRSQT